VSGTRIGHGIDAHRLVEGRPLFLGGVRIDHDRGLEGHSDGDVAAHALADAVLGAAGLGDLGRHFPSDDERWKDARGVDLLSTAASLARARGLVVFSCQVVIIAERPRLAAHTPEMSVHLARALGIDAVRVAVSATSTDGLGLIGRGEGIAASAVALLAPVS
jgi:2-C-methyl-D-erythritol 2,4-cyclodiphosphate synthase